MSELKVIKLLPKGKWLFLFGKPTDSKIAERGIEQGENHLEQPIGNDQAEHKGSGEHRGAVIKGDEHEDHSINELTGHRTEVVSQPQLPALVDFLEFHEDRDIHTLTNGEADQRGEAHTHAHTKNLLVLLLQAPAGKRFHLDEDGSHDEEDDQHDD